MYCLSDDFWPFYFQFNAIFLFLSYLISMCKVFLQNKSCFTFTSLTYKLPTKNAQSCYYIFFPNHRNTKNRMIQNYSWHTTNRTYVFEVSKQVYNNKEILLWDTISRWWLPKAMCWRKGTAASGIVAPMLWKVAKKEKPASRNVNTNMKFSAAIYIDLIGKIFHGQIFP